MRKKKRKLPKTENPLTEKVGQFMLVNPVDGEIIEQIDDRDLLIQNYHKALVQQRELYAFVADIKRLFSQLVSYEDSNTARVSTGKNSIKLTKPPVKWNNTKLKSLMSDYPELAEKYLRVTDVAPNIREIKKLETTSTSGKLKEFAERLFEAREENTDGLPSISIEELEGQ